MTDLYTIPGAPKNKTCTRRMNSLDNGLLLCLGHHKAFDAHMYSIHPEVR